MNAAGFVLLIGYFLNRFGYVFSATIFSSLLLSISSIIFTYYTGRTTFLYVCILGILVSITVQKIRVTALIYLLYLSAFIILPFISDKLTFIKIIVPATFITSMSLVIIVTVRYLIIMENFQFKQIIRTRDATIFALAYQAELRDKETGQHLERTCAYVQILAEELKETSKYKDYLTNQYIDDIKKAAMLHDIGKVGIPDTILLKNGKLTNEEFESKIIPKRDQEQ